MLFVTAAGIDLKKKYSEKNDFILYILPNFGIKLKIGHFEYSNLPFSVFWIDSSHRTSVPNTINLADEGVV